MKTILKKFYTVRKHCIEANGKPSIPCYEGISVTENGILLDKDGWPVDFYEKVNSLFHLCRVNNGCIITLADKFYSQINHHEIIEISGVNHNGFFITNRDHWMLKTLV
jgi:hypothetical protein